VNIAKVLSGELPQFDLATAPNNITTDFKGLRYYLEPFQQKIYDLLSKYLESITYR
jgi:hypothetical protein